MLPITRNTDIYYTVAELFVFAVLLCNSMAASLIVCSGTSLVNDAILLTNVSKSFFVIGGGIFIKGTLMQIWKCPYMFVFI